MEYEVPQLSWLHEPIPTVSNSVLFFQANLFILLSIICVLLNLAGFVLGHQGIQFVSSVPKCDLVSRHSDLNVFPHSLLCMQVI